MPERTRETTQELVHKVETADAAVVSAARRADTDPRRPRFHFHSPSQWMDDPNGIIYHDGRYHVMYSLNPHSSEDRAGMVYRTTERHWDPDSPDWTGGITVWGHATSTDLVHWQHEPITLFPDVPSGEHFIWFGTTVQAPTGRFMAFYTAVGPELRPEDTAEQWAAASDQPDMLSFHQLDKRPVVPNTIHPFGPMHEWRDPFVFTESGRTFMVTGGRTALAPDGAPVATLYQATDDSLENWSYTGILYEHPDHSAPSVECPNLFKVDDEWVLIMSPHGLAEWHAGSLDLDTGTFTIHRSGIVDQSKNYYATNVLHDLDSRPVLFAALEGFRDTTGWNGALSLPRRLSFHDGALVQTPADELKALRGQEVTRDVSSSGQTGTAETFEIHDGMAEFEISALQSADDGVVLTLSGQNDDTDENCGIRIEGTHVVVGPRSWNLATREEHLHLRVFVDHSVIEVFIDDTECATVVLPALPVSSHLTYEAIGSGTTNTTIRHWDLQDDELFSWSPNLTDRHPEFFEGN